jgi:hypothetical protein
MQTVRCFGHEMRETFNTLKLVVLRIDANPMHSQVALGLIRFYPNREILAVIPMEQIAFSVASELKSTVRYIM